MGSSRLPGKVLMPLAGRPVLDHVVNRVLAAERIGGLVVATSDQPGDDAIDDYCQARGWTCVRGSETDVLSRYALAARASEAGIVVRVTSDCPLFSPRILDDMLAAFDPQSMDYMSTNWPQRTFPVGLDCEIMRGDALLAIAETATDSYDREHVTPHFYRNPDRFRLAGHRCVQSLAHISITLDTSEDYDRLATLLELHPELADPQVDVVDVVARHFDQSDREGLVASMSNLREIGKRAFRDGRNVTGALRAHLGVDHNTPEAIEIAYELQAGSYAAFADSDPDFVRAYAAQLAGFLEPHLEPGDNLLDAGTGEMTTLAHMIPELTSKPAMLYATDISERRLEVGRQYAARHGLEVTAFRAELSSIPLPDAAVDVVTTNHALEPNGGREREILSELLRVAKRKLVLFEPCYEVASQEAKERMRSLGYVRELARHAQDAGGSVESLTSLSLVHNPMNPTACLVIGVPRK